MKYILTLSILVLYSIFSLGQFQEIQIFPESNFGFSNKPKSLTVVGDKMFFVSGSSSTGQELWISDGTATGTTLVKDINPGSGHSKIAAMTPFGDGKILFIADNGFNGDEIWVSDGTEEGTFLVKELKAGPDGMTKRHLSIYNTLDMLVVDDVVYFPADTDEAWQEFWRSDGTEEGTYKVGDGCTSCLMFSGELSWPTLFNDKIYFFGKFSMYYYDLVEDTQVEVFDGNDSSLGMPPYISFPFVFDDKLYFSGKFSVAADMELWVSDGTIGGAYKLKDMETGWANYNHIIFKNKLYFLHGGQLYVSDGTEAGTIPVPGFDNMFDGGDFAEFTFFEWNDHLYFNSNPPIGDIYRTSGNIDDFELVVHSGNENPYFTASENHLWMAHGWNSTQQEMGALGANGVFIEDIPLETFGNVVLEPEYLVSFLDKIVFSGKRVSNKHLMSLNPDDFPYETTSIQGLVFLDENENGIFDNDELPLDNVKLHNTTQAAYTFSNADGIFQFYAPFGENTLSLEIEESCFQVSSGQTEYIVSVVEGEISELNIPVVTNNSNNEQDIVVSLHSGPTRCGFTVPFWLTVRNNGCTPLSGNINLEQNSLLTPVEYHLSPAEINNQEIIWTYENLAPSEKLEIKFFAEIEGPDALGSLIEIDTELEVENATGQLEIGMTHNFSSVINCAYDPNDKRVKPNRLELYEENYTLFEEIAEYTIRFQNTGTDTAFNVVIRDTLDLNSFDISSFELVSASHNFRTVLSNAGVAEFFFDDILLPDSLTNEPQSHGFVSFNIKFKDGLSENHPVYNNAAIFFDFNPPIITNETESVLVSALPILDGITDINKQEQVLDIFPNPFSRDVNFKFKTNLDSSEEYTISIFNVCGKLIREIPLPPNGKAQARSLSKGIYFYFLYNGNNKTVKESGRLISH